MLTSTRTSNICKRWPHTRAASRAGSRLSWALVRVWLRITLYPPQVTRSTRPQSPSASTRSCSYAPARLGGSTFSLPLLCFFLVGWRLQRKRLPEIARKQSWPPDHQTDTNECSREGESGSHDELSLLLGGLAGTQVRPRACWREKWRGLFQITTENRHYFFINYEISCTSCI